MIELDELCWAQGCTLAAGHEGVHEHTQPESMESDHCGDPDYCNECGHFHPDYNECRAEGPCGDYRCCVN
jgi:hypothetical protein